jgi:hypothetical protein
MRAQGIWRGNWVYRQNRQGTLFIKRETFIFGAFSNKGPCFNEAVNIKRENKTKTSRAYKFGPRIPSNQSTRRDPPVNIFSSLLCSFTSSRFLQVISLSLPPPPPPLLLVRFLSISHAVVVFQKKSGKPT